MNSVPCEKSRKAGGLNKADLVEMAKAIGMKRAYQMSKQQLCEALNRVTSPQQLAVLRQYVKPVPEPKEPSERRGSLSIPCDKSRTAGGLNKTDLDKLAKSINLQRPSLMTKRALCLLLNMVDNPEHALQLGTMLQRWNIAFEWNVESVNFDDIKIDANTGQRTVAVKWVGFPQPTYEPLETFASPPAAQPTQQATAGRKKAMLKKATAKKAVEAAAEKATAEKAAEVAAKAKEAAQWREKCGSFGYLANEESIPSNHIPYADAIMNEESIEKDDVLHVLGRCWSRRALHEWVRTFIDKSEPPTNPVTREAISQADLRHAEINPLALRAYNQANYRNETFLLADMERQKRERAEREARGVYLPPRALKFVQVSVGYDHTLGLLNDGTVVGWGNNDGEKASGAIEAAADVVLAASAAIRNQLHIVAVSAGYDHSLALLNSGQVVGWGQNSFGQTTVPKLGDDDFYVEIAAGKYFSIGRSNTGRIITWGRPPQFAPLRSRYDSPYISISATPASAVVVGLLQDGTVIQDQVSPIALYEPPINVPNGKAVYAGRNYALVLDNAGQVQGWGADKLATTAPSNVQMAAISAGKLSLGLRASDGRIVAWGSGAARAEATAATLLEREQRFTAVSASHGPVKSAAVRSDGAIVMFE